MASTLENRVKELERQLSLLRRELAQVPTRIARPIAPRGGWILGKTLDDLSQGGTVAVKVIGWGSEDWYYPDVEDIQVQDFFLNVSKTIPAGTKIRADWYRNVWVWTSAYCAVSDTAPGELAATESGQPLTDESGNLLAFEYAPEVPAAAEDGAALLVEAGGSFLMEA